MLRTLLVGLAVIVTALPALGQTADWQRLIRLEDKARIDLIPSLIAEALNPAPAGSYSGTTAAEVAGLLTRPTQPVDSRALAGEWRCRSIQGGSLGIFAYAYFRCRISAAGAVMKFEKLTGSQRKSGVLYPDGTDRMVILGSATVNEQPQRPYAGTGTEDALAANAVGILTRTGTDTLLLIFPDGNGGYELYDLRRAPRR